ncbi:MAG: bifunctional YncE family protein/alkaline phosphatase family protein [Chthonomonadales bacterium]
MLPLLLAAILAPNTSQRPFLRAPALNQYAVHDPYGTTILPSGRFLRPAGRHLPVAQWPHGLALSQDGTLLFVASEGVGQIIRNPGTPREEMRTLVPRSLAGNPSNAGGAAFSPDGRLLYWSGGENGAVYIYDTQTLQKIAEVPLNAQVAGRSFADSFAMDLKLSPDGKYLYAADVTNFRIAVVDTQARRVISSIRVGRYPYALAVIGSTVYVANIGMYEYSPIPAPTKPGYDARGLSFPAFAVPSPQAVHGVEAEGRFVPGLGDPNAPEAFSVWTVDASDPLNLRVTARIKTGLLVGAPAENGKTIGGSAPNFLAASETHLYVSNGNNDEIDMIDVPSKRIVKRQRIRPSPLTASLRGVGPSGMALSPDASRLYVAASGINAVIVMDARTLDVLGFIPTAWYPYRLAVSPDGKNLYVICFKGFGNGPSAGANRPRDPFMDMKGVLSVIPVPDLRDLGRLTQTVLECNGMVDRSAERAALTSPVIPGVVGRPSPQIRYVVFITKENHTYDTIFDHVPGANDDASLLRWGYHQKIQAPGQPTLEDAAVMTNHNALARQFTVSDNFYLEPEFSGVGHRWLVGVQPNNFCQMTYTLGWEFKANSTAPGRRASFGSNGSLAPEDYPEAGSMWEHLARFRIPFRNYGEGFEFAGVLEDEHEAKTGAREVVNIPMPRVLYENTCREFPIFNMNIPDQYRVDWFIKDFTNLYLKGRRPMPPFVNIALCNDHGRGPRPERGYPYVASWMADNDLALGRIVEFLSHTPYWKNMAIFVTEDDSGGEPDHVDAQRSVLLIISPWVRHGYVSHRHTTVLSMHRTLYEILGLPPLNMFDALANDFGDCFTDRPDFAPYVHTPVDPRIFDPAKARIPDDPDYRRARLEPGPRLDDPAVIRRVLQNDE